ncbi:MAG: Rne/Rng family ribonuclease, partial [Rhodospirillaceae bacterium]|nr:Rne/Rng family ribonuclease [Rhodospirillaceae bacterium]
MVKRMLIDATHAEETRVVVLDGTRLDEFDVETSTKKQIKGNIYLAKVVRVEPSLQAAFVDYGGNRHGFLAFSEIHPDYYQIPVADREKLLAEVRRQRELDDRHAIESIDDAPLAPSQYVEHESGASDRIPDVIPTDLPPGLVDDAAGDRPAQALEARAPAITSDTLEGETGADDAPYRPRNDGDFAFADLGGRDGGDDTPSPDRMGPETMGPETMGTDTSSTAARDTADADPIAPEAAQETTHDTADSATEVAGETFADIGAESANGATGDAPVETAPRGEIIEAPSAPVSVDVLGGEEAEEAEEVDDSEKQRRRFLAQRHYKIQEVIKRRQIMLVQVVKEERGNKGAALTTYLSLAGRYCVLMPNSSRGGGVSRKITSAADRRRLKSIISELETPPSMAVILRTAGSERSKAEIKRDYEYLMRTWDNIRDVTMQSRAPALIHEEASLIKRAIRDVYSRDIEEVLVEGEDGFKIAKDFMKMLTPSHAKKVQRYADDVIPLFQRYQVESQLEAMNTPTVQLRSGGSIVFGQTEALVAIDVNSGRATRERHIEETALKTNLEAADEIARQLRLRDLAGLVVIDFIDMEESRNNHAVERRLKEALRNDRARIQVGRISHFGLLELSRQRLRPSLIETNYRPCPHCGGTGHVRSTESAAIYALRMIEEEGVRKRSSELTVTVHPSVA